MTYELMRLQLIIHFVKILVLVSR